MATNMMEKDWTVVERGSTVIQRVAICFTAGVIGGLAVVLFSHVLFALGLSATLGVNEPVSLKAPDVYRPLFWAGLWGIPFGLLVKTVWSRLYLFGRVAGAEVLRSPGPARQGFGVPQP